LTPATVSGSDTKTQSFETFFRSIWNRVKRVGVVDEERISFSNSPCLPTGRRGDTLVGVLHHPVENNSAGAAILCHGMESDKNSEKLIFLGRQLAQRGILTLRFDFSYVG
jgi:hypothetical protein